MPAQEANRGFNVFHRLLADFPLKLQTPHTRYAFHVMGDDEGSSVNDIREHRIFKDGRYYLYYNQPCNTYGGVADAPIGSTATLTVRREAA